MNHSCEPNCRQFTVSWNQGDYKIYDMALFALHDMAAGTKLTFDYRDTEDIDEEEDVDQDDIDEEEDVDQGDDTDKPGLNEKCLCRGKKCKG